MIMEKGETLPKDPWYRKYYWDMRKVIDAAELVQQAI